MTSIILNPSQIFVRSARRLFRKPTLMALCVFAVWSGFEARSRSEGKVEPKQETDPSYEVRTEVHADRANPRQGQFRVQILPRSGFHLNKEFPVRARWKTVPELTLSKTQWTGKDARSLTEEGADFDVTFTAQKAGQYVAQGELRFAVCGPRTCEPKRVDFSAPIEAK